LDILPPNPQHWYKDAAWVCMGFENDLVDFQKARNSLLLHRQIQYQPYFLDKNNDCFGVPLAMAFPEVLV